MESNNKKIFILLSFILTLILNTAISAYPNAGCDLLGVADYEAKHGRIFYPSKPNGKLRFIQASKGSNDGGWYKDEDGILWLLKPETKHAELQTGAEVVSSSLYRYLGYKASESSIYFYKEKRYTATRSLGENLRPSTLRSNRSRYFRQLRYFAAFLKDWDRLRIGPNNFDLGNEDFAMYDFGGTLGSRAQGEYKPGELLSASLGAIDGEQSFDQILADFQVNELPIDHPWRQELSLEDALDLQRKFGYFTDRVIRKAVSLAKYRDQRDSRLLADVLISRRDNILSGLDEYISKFPRGNTNAATKDALDTSNQTNPLDLKFIISFYDRSGYRSHQILHPKYKSSYFNTVAIDKNGSAYVEKKLLKKHIGSGSNGEVYLGDDGFVYKIAASPKKAPALAMEALVNNDLKKSYQRFRIRTDEIVEVGSNGVFLKKKYYDSQNMGHKINNLSQDQVRALKDLFEGAVLYARERGVGLDIKSENLWWDGREWVLIDCGPRLGYRPFGYTLDIGSFHRYLDWWDAGQGAPVGADGQNMTVQQFLSNGI